MRPETIASAAYTAIAAVHTSQATSSSGETRHVHVPGARFDTPDHALPP